MANDDPHRRREAPPRVGGLGLGRALVRYGSISSLIGIGIQVFISLDSPQQLRPRSLLAGALVGFCLCVGSLTAEALLLRLVPRPRRPEGFLFQALAYFLGGMAGLLLASVLSEAALDIRLLAANRLYSLAVFGGLSAAIGLTFATIGRLRYRLEQSVAELKDREFAAKELETAREIQQRLLPAPDTRGDGYRIAARNRAARIVGGDFYDVFRLADGALGIAVADVAGKGLGAALIMASVKAILPLVAAERGVAAALCELNQRLEAELGPRAFVALAYARFEPATGRLELANAGLPDPLLLVPGEPPRELEAPGPRLPLGVMVPVEYSSVIVELGVGEWLLLYSDGLVEVRRETEATGIRESGSAGRAGVDILLGFEGLRELIGAVDEPEPGDFLDEVLHRVEALGGGVLDDDCTAVLLVRDGTSFRKEPHFSLGAEGRGAP